MHFWVLACQDSKVRSKHRDRIQLSRSEGCVFEPTMAPAGYVEINQLLFIMRCWTDMVPGIRPKHESPTHNLHDLQVV